MTITFKNNTLYLPIFEARQIKEGVLVPLLFEVSNCLVEGTDFQFDLKRSEPFYPSSIREKELNTIAEKYNLNSFSCKHNNSNLQTYQLAQFWHYLGDATHCSEYVPTPFGFYPGLTITIENQFNVKPISSIIQNVKLTRNNEEKWFWLIEIQRF